MLFRDKKYEVSPQCVSEHPTISRMKLLPNISNVSDSGSHSSMMPSLLTLISKPQDCISHSMNSITGLINWQAIPLLKSQHVTYNHHSKGSRKYRSDPTVLAGSKCPRSQERSGPMYSFWTRDSQNLSESRSSILRRLFL